MAFQWSVTPDYSTYYVNYAGQDWAVVTEVTEAYRRFALYDGDLNLVYNLPSSGGLYLALDFAQGLITKKVPESLAAAANL